MSLDETELTPIARTWIQEYVVVDFQHRDNHEDIFADIVMRVPIEAQVCDFVVVDVAHTQSDEL